MSTRARQVLEEARRRIAPVDERIRRHPYLDVLESGKADRGRLAIFPAQQRHIIESDLRSVALIIARSESQPTRDFFIGMLQGERAALQALSELGHALRLTDVQLLETDPLPGAFAYSAYVSWLALYGSPAEFAGAFLVNLEAWGANCSRLSRALQTRYDLTGKAVAFFDLFATPPAGFEEQGLAVVEEGLTRGVEPARIWRAAMLLQGLELLYWDTMLREAEV